MFDFVGCQKTGEDASNEGDSFLTFNSSGADPWLALAKMAGKIDKRFCHIFPF